jgi:hypothetical protein
MGVAAELSLAHFRKLLGSSLRPVLLTPLSIEFVNSSKVGTLVISPGVRDKALIRDLR